RAQHITRDAKSGTNQPKTSAAEGSVGRLVAALNGQQHRQTARRSTSREAQKTGQRSDRRAAGTGKGLGAERRREKGKGGAWSQKQALPRAMGAAKGQHTKSNDTGRRPGATRHEKPPKQGQASGGKGQPGVSGKGQQGAPRGDGQGPANQERPPKQGQMRAEM